MDSDCAVVTDGCNCYSGGRFLSINKNYVDYWKRYKYLKNGGECYESLNLDWNCLFEIK